MVSIDVDGDYVIVGARKTKIGTKQNAGEVYIYKNNNDNWNRVKKLSLSNPTANDEFGYGLSIKNDIIAVGVPGKKVMGIRMMVLYCYIKKMKVVLIIGEILKL